MCKNFIDLSQISKKDICSIIDIARDIKNKSLTSNCLRGKNIAMIFEKSSTRTRVSFEVGINQLGGSAIIMNANDMQLSKGEEVSDTAKVLSRYVDAVIIRSKYHQTIEGFASNADIPVINALSDLSHPCQIMASILTIIEKLGSLENRRLAWFGEHNNVLNSYIQLSAILDFELIISSPSEMSFSNSEIENAKSMGAKIEIIFDPLIAAKNCDVLITDTWFSMGDAAFDNPALRQKKIDLLALFKYLEKKWR